jgi:hypothetical protein
MPDRRRIFLIGLTMTLCCVLLLPAAVPAVKNEAGSFNGIMAILVYLAAFVAGPGMLRFSTGGGALLAPRLGLAVLGYFGYLLVRGLVDFVRSASAMAQAGGSVMVLQGLLTIGFILLVCVQLGMVLMAQDGSEDRLAASTPLPVPITARLYGGVLTLTFASTALSSGQGMEMALALLGLGTGTFLKISVFLMFLGGLVLLLMPMTPVAAAACRLIAVVQVTLTLWALYTVYSIYSQFAAAAGSGSGSMILWMQVASVASCAVPPVIFTWGLSDEVSPNAV